MTHTFKTRLLTTLLLLAAFALPGTSQAAHAKHAGGPGAHGIGVGVIFGEPTGATAKFWTRHDRAVDVGLAFSFNNFFLIYGDYLFHFPGLFGNSSTFVSELSPYVGLGALMLFSTNSFRFNQAYFNGTSTFGLGFRIPLGVEWSPGDPPIGIFAELVPGLGIVPGTFGFLEGGIGVRYYF